MLFNSHEFMIFLPIVFLLYWFVFRKYKLQNLFLIIASYIFYGWWDWRFLILIIATSLFSYTTGLLVGHNEGRRHLQRIWSTVNILANLGILCVFKYYNFFLENLNLMFRTLGFSLDWVTLKIVLPVGISFYTFQALSYTIDVYRGDIKPTRDIVAFFAYISFFPQLVAGPIERAKDLLPQFQKHRQFENRKAVDGLRQMLWGFFKKLVIADNCAFAVNSCWDAYTQLPGFTILFMGFLFTFQIYCDFSGYSDIAIGCARLFGINLRRNFDYPYFSRNISEFWRKWHISLMTWFRDYIYFPLGGSRCTKWKVVRNTMIVFFLSGLWHGANWTFIVWGLYHACLISILIFFGISTKEKNNIGFGKLLPTMKESLQMVVTFLLVSFGWIIFRAENMTQCMGLLRAMFTNPFFKVNQVYGGIYIIHILLLLIIEWLQRNKQHALQFPDKGLFLYRPFRWTIYVSMYIYIITSTGQSQTFLYFQF